MKRDSRRIGSSFMNQRCFGHICQTQAACSSLAHKHAVSAKWVNASGPLKLRANANFPEQLSWSDYFKAVKCLLWALCGQQDAPLTHFLQSHADWRPMGALRRRVSLLLAGTSQMIHTFRLLINMQFTRSKEEILLFPEPTAGVKKNPHMLLLSESHKIKFD